MFNIDEYYTSKKCHKCLNTLGNYHPPIMSKEDIELRKQEKITMLDTNQNEEARSQWIEKQWAEKLLHFKFYDDDEKVPYSKLKVCQYCKPSKLTDDIDKFMIIHRDKNACINILNKFIMLLKNETFPKALDRRMETI